MLGTLLRFDATIRRNRLGSGWIRPVMGLAALLGLGLGGHALLDPAATETLAKRVDPWVFWSMTAAALVLGYASFEVLYRDAVSRRLTSLPLEPGAHYLWKVYRVYRAHLPLLLIPAASGASLLIHGHWLFWLQGVITTAAVVIWGLALAIFAHLWAGQSLLDGGTRMKSMLASGFGPPETAFLFYSPAAALLGALLIGTFVRLALGTAITRGIWDPLLVISGIASVASVVALVRARAIFVADHHRIAPRFNDAEIPPPWQEGELPRAVFGLGLGRWLPIPSRPVWTRDLVQYRRRFRIVLPLTVLSALAVFGYALSTADTDGAGLRVLLAATAVGVLAFIPVFRSAGPELARRFDTRAMPIGESEQRHVQWLLAATEWAPLAGAGGLGLMVGGDLIGGLVAAAGTAVVFVITQAIAIPVALRASPDVGLSSWVIRGSLLLGLGLGSSALRLMGV